MVVAASLFRFQLVGAIQIVTQLAQRLPKHYQTTKNPSKRYQEILQLPNHYQVATIFGVICDQQITTR